MRLAFKLIRVKIQYGSFETSDCAMLRPFVCKAEFYDMPVPDWSDIDEELGPPVPCEAGWELHGHHCNRVFPNVLQYEQAQTECLIHGANLGSIHSLNFNDAVF